MADSPDDLGPWWKGGIVGGIFALLVWVITKTGPKQLEDFRNDVSKLVDTFTKSLVEQDGTDATERALDRAMITKIADQFTEALKEERAECRAEREADREYFRVLVRELVEEEMRTRHNA